MLLACLPDVDILFQSIGVVPQKSYTHSLILSIIIVPAITFGIARWRKVSAGAVLIYSLAYVQHIAIGDIAIGGTNILYPFGSMLVGSGIGYGTLIHQTIEFVLLVIAAAIMLSRAFKTFQEKNR